MIYNVAVIGSGQLGSRHLQGLLKSNLKFSLEVVEPNSVARKTTVERIAQLPVSENSSSIKYLDSVLKLSNNLDFVVVATNSDVRFQISQLLLNSKKVKYLVLEKVLFQKPTEYFQFQELLETVNTQCWVNHPRRCFPFYKGLKNKLRLAKNIDFSVSGGGWGLACNSLHFLDLIAFLTGEESYCLNSSFVKRKLLNTKRESFHELTGRLIGSFGNATFTINHFEDKSPMQISISSDIANIFIDESEGWCRIKNEEMVVSEEKIVYFQSELTGTLLDSVIKTGKCDLPSYSDSMKVHLPFINELVKVFKDAGFDTFNQCPIT